jgi:multiple sugar transport system substrate-binding protein/sn-glycerol 3-phosphate transport system substrate-binding protein
MKTRVLFIIAAAFILFLVLSQLIPNQQPSIPANQTGELTEEVTPTAPAIPVPTPTDSVPINLQITPAALDGIHITYWHPWVGKMGDVITGLIAGFNKNNTYGITVDERRFGGEQALGDQVSQSIEENKTPNLIAAPSEQLVEWQVPQQELVDLNDYIFSSAYGLSPMQQSDYFSDIWNSDVIDGVRFGIPATRTGQALYYNITWARELGFDSAPATAADFTTQACAASQANVNLHLAKAYGTGGWLIDTSWETDLSWLGAFHYASFPVADSNAFSFETSEFENTQTFLRDLYDRSCAWYSSHQSPQTYLALRYALFYSGDIQQIPIQLGAQIDANSNDEWAVIPFPGENGSPVFLVHGNSYAVFLSTPEEQLASWLFIRWMEETENQIELVKTEGSLPLTYSAVQALTDYSNGRTQWESVIQYLDNATTPPSNEYWLKARPVVEDSFMMLLSPQYVKANVTNMAKVLDATIQEVLAQEP